MNAWIQHLTLVTNLELLACLTVICLWVVGGPFLKRTWNEYSKEYYLCYLLNVGIFKCWILYPFTIYSGAKSCAIVATLPHFNDFKHFLT